MRWRWVFLVLGLGLCGGQVHAAAADAILSEVSAALAAGQYEQAVTVAGSGLAEPGIADLTRGRLLIVRGLARQALGANDDALADFTLALSIAGWPSEERARALFARGVSLDSLERLNDAVGDYSAVLQLRPGAPYALNNRANIRRRQGRLDEAKRDYLAALNGTNPNPQYPYFGLGQIAEAEGDLAGARTAYNKALAAAPGFPLALERLRELGAPVEGPAGLPADTGIIVLKSPSARSEEPITLRPPEAKPAAAVPAVAPPAIVPAAAPAPRRRQPPAGAGRGTPLRPTIVEGRPRGMGALAQLGAWRSEAEARNGWAVAQDGAGGLLDGLSPVIVRAEIPGRGVFWRLRVASAGPAGQFCAALAAKGLACLPARD